MIRLKIISQDKQEDWKNKEENNRYYYLLTLKNGSGTGANT
jgi:hypothetical protein